ncbi:MAG: DUF222 domain-containing protein [Frankiales bacterium]|nr:MAG: DUF222 domain-containing protein [Frankiales bacterium]
MFDERQDVTAEWQSDASAWAMPGVDRPKPPVTPSEAVQALVDDVQKLCDLDPSSLTGQQALVDARALLAAREQLDNALLKRVADIDVRRLHDLEGAGSTTSWVGQQQSSMSRDAVTLARRLGRLPAVQAALDDRTLSVEVAQRLSRALAKLRPVVDRPDGLIDGQDGEQALAGVIGDGVVDLFCQSVGGLDDDDPRLTELIDLLAQVQASGASQIARLEAAFVLLATRLEPGQLPHALRMLTDALLPNELEKRAARGEDEAGLTLVPKDDGSGWRVDGDLDLETGELLHTVLKAEMAVDEDNPVDTAAWRRARESGVESADELPESGAPRSIRRRRHDALRNALRRLLDSGALGSRDKVAPHISVLVRDDGLAGAPGALPATAGSGTALPGSVVRRWWCDINATRFVMSLGRKVIEASHTERTLKPHERRAKHAETGGRCQTAGCRCRPGQRLIPHHVYAFARHGTTSLQETVLLCERDHALLHQGKTIRLRDGRLIDEHGWV